MPKTAPPAPPADPPQGVIPQRYEAAVPLARLTPHPANPNQGDVGLLTQLLEANGFAGAVLAQESTGILVDGETRWHAAAAEGLGEIPVIWLDISDDTRDRLLASINEAGRRGANDEAKLLALLTGLAVTPRGLEGAAFDGDDLDALIKRLNPEPPEGFKDYDDDIPTSYRCPSCGYTWSGSPEGKNGPVESGHDGNVP
jgi:hypothetical protein